MIQSQTDKYKLILREFYCIISQRHQQKAKNREALEKLLEKLTIKNIHKQSQKEGKTGSMMTECSLSEINNNPISQNNIIQPQNEMFYTFSPVDGQLSRQTNQKKNCKYWSPSIFRVALYSMLFNQIYMKALSEKTSQKIAALFNQTQYIVQNIISAVKQLINLTQLISIEKKCNLSALKDHIQKQKKFLPEEWEKKTRNIIQKIDNDMIQILFLELAKPLAQNARDQKTPTRCSKQQIEVHFKRVQQTNKYKNEQVLRKLADKLQIRIKLHEGEEKLSWGPRKAIISLFLKRSSKRGEFYLKEISYYSIDNSNNSNLKKNQKII